MAGPSPEGRFGLKGVSKGSVLPTGCHVCPKAVPRGLGLKSFPSQEDLGQHCSRMDCGQTVRTGVVVDPRAVDPFPRRPAWRQALGKLIL